MIAGKRKDPLDFQANHSLFSLLIQKVGQISITQWNIFPHHYLSDPSLHPDSARAAGSYAPWARRENQLGLRQVKAGGTFQVALSVTQAIEIIYCTLCFSTCWPWVSMNKCRGVTFMQFNEFNTWTVKFVIWILYLQNHAWWGERDREHQEELGYWADDCGGLWSAAGHQSDICQTR